MEGFSLFIFPLVPPKAFYFKTIDRFKIILPQKCRFFVQNVPFSLHCYKLADKKSDVEKILNSALASTSVCDC